MMTLIKCFSVLVASGNGPRCNDLREVIHDQLLSMDRTGSIKVLIFKYQKKSKPKDFHRVASELTRNLAPLYSDIDDHFFCDDNASQ